MYPWRSVWFLSAMVATAFTCPSTPPPIPECLCTTLTADQSSKDPKAVGHTKGYMVIETTIKSLQSSPYLACLSSNGILVVKIRDESIEEIKKWVQKQKGELDKCHPVKVLVQVGGKSDQEQDKEEKNKRSAVQPSDAETCVLPTANCVIITGTQCVVSEGQQNYLSSLNRFRMLLQPGGDLKLAEDFNIRCY